MQQNQIEIAQPKLAKFFFANPNMAWLWLIVRVYVGWQWLYAGYEKLINPAWAGPLAGTAIKGFFMGSLQKAAGMHPDVQWWYANFIQNFCLQHTVGFSYLITGGEIAVGIALILGLFTGIAAFFGSFMNVNYLLAGTVSINPILLVLQIFIILAWRISGWFGLDRYIFPKLYK